MTKVCTQCHQILPEENFFIRDKTTGRRHAQCKDCYKIMREKTYKAHYRKHKNEYIARAKKHNQTVFEKYREIVINYLQEHPCVDCGEKDIVVLDFHHIDPKDKTDTISNLMKKAYSSTRLKREIDKCIILCSNCHRRRTAKEFGWKKYLLTIT